MHLEKVDLNLLLVFNRLMIDRRVSTAAEGLGVSQPAISNALRRLRVILNDELFLRTARGMEPTAFAEQIAEPIAYALDSINGALSQKHVFDAAKSERTFTLAMTDIGEIYFMPSLLTELRKAASGISINTVRNSGVDIQEEMERGRIDAAVGLLPQLQAGFYRQRLFKQKYVCLVGGKYPASKRKELSRDDFERATHVVVVAGGTGHGEIDKLLQRKGVKRRVVLTVPHFVAVGHILQDSDLMATVPQRLADSLVEPFGLKCFPHPIDLPEHSIDLFWHAKMHKDPANQWLRRLVFSQFSE